MQGERRAGRAKKVWYRLYDGDTGRLLEGEEGLSTEGYVNTYNQHTGRIPRVEANRRYEITEDGRRFDFPASKGGYSFMLEPRYQQHSPRTISRVLQQSQRTSSVKSDDDEEERALVYEGETKLCQDGQERRHGKGSLKVKGTGEVVYSGDWLYDEKHGKGEHRWEDGSVYNGAWVHGRMQGQGSFRWKNGTKYNGEFYDGTRHGWGIQLWPREESGAQIEYEGWWMHDQRQGRGKLRYPDGRMYDGEWKDGDISGEGFLHYANGWTYEGEFLAGFKHGNGIRTEWYGGTGGVEGMRYTVTYSYNTMQEKQVLGPCRKEAGNLRAPERMYKEHVTDRRLNERRVRGRESTQDGSMSASSQDNPSLRNSPPNSPPFSPTDHIMDKHVGGVSHAKSGNWTLGSNSLIDEDTD